MANEMMTISATTRMFRQIPVRNKMPDSEGNGTFEDSIRNARDAVSGQKPGKAEMTEYRQMLYNRFQSMPYDSTNQLDTTTISISDAGIERMMNDPAYEKWVTDQVRSTFSFHDSWASLSGGKFIMMRIGAEEKDLQVTMERAGFPGGQDSMMPKVHKEDDEGYWERREKRFEEQMDMMEEIQQRKEAGLPIPLELMELITKSNTQN